MTRRPRFVPEPVPTYPEPRTPLQVALRAVAKHADGHTGQAVWPDRCSICRELVDRAVRERLAEGVR